MFCESCGKNIPDESRFCEYCGSEVIPESVIYSQEDIDNSIHSEQESASYNKQERGSRYEQEIEKEYEYPRTPKPKKSGLIKKAAVFLILAVVLVGGYSLLRQFIGKNPERIVENSAKSPMVSESIPQEEQLPVNGPENNGPENNLPAANDSVIINEDDFNWHFEEYYYEIPDGAIELSYMDILGE